jgi:hypothetical protein
MNQRENQRMRKPKLGKKATYSFVICSHQGGRLSRRDWFDLISLKLEKVVSKFQLAAHF